jgi:ABC-type Mn2+/Zn2+ transport system ATPase subunit
VSVGIRLEGVSVTFSGRPVLQSVDVTIPPGERTALVGPNGGGKTTLVKVILGVLEPDEGRVVFVDDAGKELERPRIGYLPQRSTLSPDAPLSGLDLVLLSLRPRAGFSFGANGDKDEARSALQRAGLDPERMGVPVGRLSGGQRQRVILARALAGSPGVLLLDEPDTALDAAGMKTLRRIVGEEVSAGRTVIYVTHDSGAMGGADAVFRIDGTVTGEAL